MEATRAEKNRVIAEWLSLLCGCDKDQFGYSRHGYGTATGRCYKCNGLPADLLPDFYASEEASALARDAMLRTGHSLYLRKDRLHLFKGVMFDTDEEIGEFYGSPIAAIAEAAYLCAVKRKALAEAHKNVCHDCDRPSVCRIIKFGTRPCDDDLSNLL